MLTKISKAQLVVKAQSCFGDNVKIEYRRGKEAGWYLSKANNDSCIGQNVNEAWDWLNQLHYLDLSHVYSGVTYNFITGALQDELLYIDANGHMALTLLEHSDLNEKRTAVRPIDRFCFEVGMEVIVPPSLLWKQGFLPLGIDTTVLELTKTHVITERGTFDYGQPLIFSDETDNHHQIFDLAFAHMLKKHVACEKDRPKNTGDRPDRYIGLSASGKFLVYSRFADDSEFKKFLSAIREVPGRTFNYDARANVIPRRVESILALRDVVMQFVFQVSPDAERLMQDTLEQAMANVTASRAEKADLNVEGLGGELRPFQRAGVAYAVRAKRTFIADEMGLGKTVQALAVIQAIKAYPALIVCPASLKLNWQREAEKWLPGRSVSIFTTKANSADIEIINYDVLKKNLDTLKVRGFKAIIYDESHVLKNIKAQRTEAAAELAKGVEIRLALTGTPVLNRPQELLSQLKILGRLDDMGGFWKFAERYCAAQKTRWGWDFSGAAHLDELNEKLRSICYIRRDKATVLTELPAKQRSVISLDIDNRSEYQKVEKNLVKWLVEQKGEKLAERAKYAEQLVKIEYLKQMAAQGKLAALFEWIESFLESGEKLVLFATHQNIIDAVAQRFGALKITGETPQEQRQKIVDKFQIDPETKLVVMNMRAGGVGLTLTAASNVAFFELGWTPADHSQAEDRCHRIGQQNSVNIWYLLANQTIDEEIYQLIEAKRKVVDVATEGATEGGEMEGNSILQELVANIINAKGSIK